MFLCATTDSFKVNLTSALETRLFASYTTISSTDGSFVGSGNESSKPNTTGDKTLLSAPGSSSQTKMLRFASIENVDASNDQIVKVMIEQSGAVQTQIWAVTLAPGETLQYEKGLGWFILAARRAQTAEAFCTAETTISAATYADITGASITLGAGVWAIMAQINFNLANAIIQGMFAITDGSNNVISEVAQGRPASGTASVAAPMSAHLSAIVSPGSSTTYKLRGARALTQLTGNLTVMDGNGLNTTNNLTNNSDKGTSIRAVKIGMI